MEGALASGLDTFQVNMLLTGRDLYAALPQAPEGRLVFLNVWGYEHAPDHPWGRPPSIFLNADHSGVRFGVRVFEVDRAAVHAGYDDAERDLVFRNEITSLDELQQALATYLDDFSALVSSIAIP